MLQCKSCKFLSSGTGYLKGYRGSQYMTISEWRDCQYNLPFYAIPMAVADIGTGSNCKVYEKKQLFI